MTIRNSEILLDPSTAFTGGTAKPLSFLSFDKGQFRLFLDGTTVLDRTEAEFSAKSARPKTDAPNGYTQQRRTANLRVPKTLANGKLTYATVTVSISSDIEHTDAEVDTLRAYGAQLLMETDYNAFWRSLSLD